MYRELQHQGSHYAKIELSVGWSVFTGFVVKHDMRIHRTVDGYGFLHLKPLNHSVDVCFLTEENSFSVCLIVIPRPGKRLVPADYLSQ